MSSPDTLCNGKRYAMGVVRCVTDEGKAGWMKALTEIKVPRSDWLLREASGPCKAMCLLRQCASRISHSEMLKTDLDSRQYKGSLRMSDMRTVGPLSQRSRSREVVRQRLYELRNQSRYANESVQFPIKLPSTIQWER